MKKKALRTSTFREIWQSKARFLSILGIILLGVAFYAGIKATGPDMIDTADAYYRKTKLMDEKVQSSLGLSKQDIALLQESDHVADVWPMMKQDVNLSAENRVVAFYSYPTDKKPSVNHYRVIEGRLPKKSGEIALDAQTLENKKYRLHDTFVLSGDKDSLQSFKKHKFKIVGFVNSPMFIEKISRGNTTVGKGSVDYFGVISEADFKQEVYSEAYIRYRKTKNVQAYSAEYDRIAKAETKEIKALFKNRPKERLKEVKATSEQTLAAGKKQWEAGQRQLKTAKQKLTAGEQELAKGQTDLQQARQTYQAEIAAAETKLTNGSVELKQAKQYLAGQQTSLAQAEAELTKGQAALAAAAQALTKQGISPTTDITILQGQASGLKQASGQFNATANSIVAVAGATPDGASISTENLNAWQASLANPLIDLSDIGQLLASLTDVPLNADIRGQLQAAAGSLQAASQTLVAKAAPLEQAIQALQHYQTGQKELVANQQKIANGRQQLQAGQTKITTSEAELAAGQQALAIARQTGLAKLQDAEEKIKSSQKELVAGKQKLLSETNKLAQANSELTKNSEALAKIKPAKYFFTSRENNPGYQEYRENAKRISSIATVFPVFFFLIAALVSLTTMTRMVDEKRGEIGTLKALGYRNSEIVQKYVVYATSASLVGSIIGLVLGYYIFPSVIFNAYGSLYNLPPVIISSYPSYSLQSIIVALLCTLIAALVVLRVDLASTPAKLMRPKAPKSGQRILLERLTFIWQRLNFNQKVTARNLFRYKQRMFMTIFGIAGCMALMITGFGLRDSITDVVKIQFDKLWHYQAVVTYNDEADKQATEEYQKAITALPNYQDHLTVAQQSMRVMKKGVTTQDATIYVPKDVEKLSKFVLFNQRKTGKKYSLDDSGVIINEKLAKMFHLKVGDRFSLTDSHNQKIPVKIAQIVENYAFHFVYMTPSYYQKVMPKNDQTIDFNSDLLLFKKKVAKAKENKMAEQLMNYNKVLNVTFLSTTSSAMDDTVASLNIVVWVLIICAAGLAFIVLYNLTNINISERIRELSTIKVLGFYDNEVTRYVYRENDILTILGIAVGCVLGKFLHAFVLQTAEVDILMFSPAIHFSSYFYSAVLTILFSLIVMYFMHIKLKNVDMIEALKSNE